MEYQKIINLLDNTKNEPSKFKAKNWVDINDESRETYNEDNQTRFKTSSRQVDMNIVMDIYLLKELQQSETKQLKINQIIP